MLFIALLQSFVQFSTPLFADTDDSFYHAKMALLLWEQGLPRDFPWLYFTTLHYAYVDHHLLFHILLIPFVLLGKVFYGATDTALFWGAKVGVITGISLAFGAFYALLDHFKIRYTPLWIGLLLAAPYDFYFRLHMVRVQSYSLFVMLLGLGALFTRRYVLVGVLCFFYVSLYGGAFFLPMFLGIYFLLRLLIDKTWEWKLLAYGAGGFILGFLTDPYFLNMFGFLKQQIFETGLGYAKTELNVGGEWRPYDTWYLMEMGWLTFIVLGAGILVSLRKGITLGAKELTILVIQFLFLVLMWKSKRFIEYWPAFAVLSAALLWNPILQDYAPEKRAWKVVVFFTGSFGIIFTTIAVVRNWVYMKNIEKIYEFFPAIVFFFFAVLIFYSLFLLATTSKQDGTEWKNPGKSLIFALVCALLPFGIIAQSAQVVQDITPRRAYVAGAKAAMNCVLTKGNAQPGDIVMTDDWDVFPLFFFFNHTTNYIVGLDPVFMYKFDKNLYQQFAQITIGTDGEDLPNKIKNIFKAKFVVMDRDHHAFRANIERYPDNFVKLCDGEFAVFGVK